MRTLEAGLRAHLDGTCTTLCYCWKVSRKDGVTLGFTDHDEAISFDGITFEALAGFQSSAAEAKLGLNIDTQEVVGALSSDMITEDDLISGRYDDAKVEVWLVNWSIINEREYLRQGFLGEISREDNRFTAEFRSLTNLLDQTKGRRFMSLCDAVLGDTLCAVSLSASQNFANGTISELRSRLIYQAAGLDSFADEWFAHGRLLWISGKNINLAVELSSNRAENGSTSIQLWKPMPFDIEVGDTFKVTAGCDKSFATCKAKFSNHLNFGGFPHMPGNDFSLSYVGSANDHDGSPLVD